MWFAEFLKYKVEKPGAGSLSSYSLGAGGTGGMDEPVSGMLWVHLLAGRGLRPSTGTSAATTPVTPSGGAPSITSKRAALRSPFSTSLLAGGSSGGLRDLYCVLECDRVHKARTVVSGPSPG